jgi:hypothetical protein
LAAGTVLAGIGAAVAQDKVAPNQLNPGFNLDTGQINSGVSTGWPSGSPPGHMEQSGTGDIVKDIAKPVGISTASDAAIPSPDEAAAIPPTGSSNPSAGQQAVAPMPATDGKDASGQKAPDAEKSAAAGANDAEVKTGAQDPVNATVGAAPADKPATAAAPIQSATPVAGPIGATAQTMPAKFSARNDALDKLSTMAIPPALSAEQKQKIAAAAKADRNPAVAFDYAPAAKIPEAVELSALPEDLGRQMPGVKFVKTKDKVLLVNLADRAVVGTISP